MTQKSPASFVTTVSDTVIDKIKNDLENQGFTFSKPQYTHFSAKKKGLSVTLYTSLKLLVQGSEMKEFIEFYLEPEILQDFSFTHKNALVDKRARIGVDEAGKGDFFGALCIASVYADEKAIAALLDAGIRDSKKMKDPQIEKLAKIIRNVCSYEVIQIGPEKYNQLYKRFMNLNSLLAWGHATAIEKLSIQSGCKVVIIDKFAHDYVVQNALKKKSIEISLEQKVRAEEDVVVAAASILARDAFVKNIDNLSKLYEITLPKGASKLVKDVGKKLVAKYGPGILEKVAKTHFKTSQEILQEIC